MKTRMTIKVRGRLRPYRSPVQQGDRTPEQINDYNSDMMGNIFSKGGVLSFGLDDGSWITLPATEVKYVRVKKVLF